MAKLTSFTFISIDGYYKTTGGDISWHKHETEEASFSEESLEAGNILLFGRATYEMMFSFWPTQMAYDSFPVVAEGMNKSDKIVFSTTMKKAEWENTSIINSDIVNRMRELKKSGTKDMTILGSGSILTQFADAGLIDVFQVMIDPVALGSGIPIFNNIKHQLNLHLISSRTFKSGSLLLEYAPA